MGRRAYSYLSRHPFDRTIALGVTLVVFAASWYRFATFRSATYDLGVFQQVVWKMAHGHGATSSLTAWNTFGDHLSPVLLVFVPFFWLASHPAWFFLAQALAVGLAVLLVRPLAEAVGLKDRPVPTAMLVGLVAVNPAIWNAAMFDFHPTTLAIPVLLFGCHAAIRHHYRGMWLCLALLIFLRDDLAIAGLAVAFVGWRSDNRHGQRDRLIYVAACLAWTVIGAQVGTMLGASRHFEARYGYLGPSMIGAAKNPIHAAVGMAQHVFAADNLVLVLLSLGALALLPALRPGWAGLAFFVALPMMAADDANFHSYSFHYGATVAPFLILAAAGGLVRLRPELSVRAALAALPIGATALALLGPPVTGTFAAAPVSVSDAERAVALVPADATVAASNVFGPHLANREHLIPFPFPFVDTKVSFPLDPRVTSTAQADRDKVDAVIVPKPTTAKAEKLLAAFLATPDAKEFTQVKVGDVLLFRRTTP